MGALGGDRGGDPEVRRVELQILQHVEAKVGVWTLRHDADPLSHPHRFGGDIGAGHEGAAGSGPNSRGEHADRGRLTGSVRTEQAEKLSRTDVEVERVECDYVAGRAERSGRTERRAGRSAVLRLPASLIDFSQRADFNGGGILNARAIS